MDFGKTVFLFLSILGTALWIGMVMKAEGEDKLREACYPISFTMDVLGDATEGLTGYRPEWVSKVKFTLEGGCYYFFSVILSSDKLDEGTTGGVRK